MDHKEVGRYWNENAHVWTRLARAGYDIYRDYLNTPAFSDHLPEVDGLTGIDIRCGEGHNASSNSISYLLVRHATSLAVTDFTWIID